MTPALLFDFGGTLDADGEPWKERFHALYRAEGVAPDPEAFAPVFYGADDALVGALPITCGLTETAARLAAGVSAGLGVADARVAARVADAFLESALSQLARNRKLLEGLRERYRLGIVSNFYGNLDAVCAEAGIADLFDVIVDSTRVGVSKPDPRIFRYATDALGVGPAEATFVGDSPSRDMGGARAVGMRHVWLAGPRAVIPAPCCPGDRVICRLADLDAAL